MHNTKRTAKETYEHNAFITFIIGTKFKDSSKIVIELQPN